MAMNAVLTGDVVNSTKLGKANQTKLLKILKKVLAPCLFEFYRGDSFQAYLKDPKPALRIALLCRAAAIGITGEEKAVFPDVRISIGIGTAKNPVKILSTATGEAFLFSGRAFDEIVKTETKLFISTINPLANAGLQVVSDYLNEIFKTMTTKQAQVIFELLNGNTQQEVAKKLKRTKSTINQHVSSGKWFQIEKLLNQYETIINQIK